MKAAASSSLRLGSGLCVFLVSTVALASPSDDGGVVPAVPTAVQAPSRGKGLDLRWSHQTTPTPGPARAIGQPGAGCLEGGVALPLHGPGWLVARPQRHREFGHPVLRAFLQGLAKAGRRHGLGTITVGDMGQARGGPTPSGHRSHQNGLDVDVWYGPAKAAAPGKKETTLQPPSVVDMQSNKMLPAWTDRAARLVRTAAEDPAVDRIFVHPAVKRALCKERGKHGPWLQRVRPWWGHQDHFHVRLRCPPGNVDCVESKPLPPGDGCDASLSWWFSSEAHTRAQERAKETPGETAPPMPEKCEKLVEQQVEQQAE
jgi:penicillin-insensitive murein endopeptidase